MSVAVMAWAWRQDIPTSQKIVLLALADHSDDDGVCWPGQKGIAAKTGLTRQTVNLNIAKLAESGCLIVLHRFDPEGRALTNRYRLKCVDQGGGVGETDRDSRIDALGGVGETDTNHQKKPSEETSNSSSTRVRPFPPDFDLTDSDKEFARSRGMSDIGEEVVKFITYHESKNNKFSDWHKAWRTWALNYRPSARPPSRDPDEPNFGTTGMANLAKHLRAAEDERREQGRNGQATDPRQGQLVPPTNGRPDYRDVGSDFERRGTR